MAELQLKQELGITVMELRSIKEAAKQEKREKRIEKQLHGKYENQLKQLEEQLEDGRLALDERRSKRFQLQGQLRRELEELQALAEELGGKEARG